MTETLLRIFGLFSVLSMLAFGGGAGAIPEMKRAAVETHGWMTSKEFLDVFALSRAAPGPGSMIAVLIGQKAGGLAGAAVAFVAMFGPSCFVVYFVARGWERASRQSWRATVEQALAPIAIGLTFASGLALARGTETEFLTYGITIVTTLAFAFTSLHPILLLVAGAAMVLLFGG